MPSCGEENKLQKYYNWILPATHEATVESSRHSIKLEAREDARRWGGVCFVSLTTSPEENRFLKLEFPISWVKEFLPDRLEANIEL